MKREIKKLINEGVDYEKIFQQMEKMNIPKHRVEEAIINHTVRKYFFFNVLILVLIIISLSPLISIYFNYILVPIIATSCLSLLVYGTYKLNRACIIIWMILISLIIIYWITGYAYVKNHRTNNILFATSITISIVLFCSSIVLMLSVILSKIKLIKDQF